MNHIFMGVHHAGDNIYDYSGIWTRTSRGIEWKAIVLHADVVGRPRGVITQEPGGTDEDVADHIRRIIEDGIDALQKPT